jgi:MerC mercury resistance protein
MLGQNKDSLELNKKLDQLGLTCSLLCGIHCAITPLVISLFIAFGLNKMLSEEWEALDLICLSVSPFIAFFSLREGLFQHHSKWPVLLFCLGFLCLLIGYFSSSKAWHPYFMSLGGFTVALSHLINLKLLKPNKKPIMCNKGIAC